MSYHREERKCLKCKKYIPKCNGKYCSQDCMLKDENYSKRRKGQKAWNKGLGKKNVSKICKCGKVFFGYEKKYCSMKCYHKYQAPWNKNLTKEIDGRVLKNAINISKTMSTYYIKHKHPRLGKEGMKGKKNPNWRGGISNEPYGYEFNKKLKLFIRERDGYRCQQCFRHQEELKQSLTVHHIDFNKKNNNVLNLIALCHSCNSSMNYKRDDWIQYFQALQKKRGIC